MSEEIHADAIAKDLDAHGFVQLHTLLSPSECAHVAALYEDDALFRKRIVMSHHGYGRGEYKYFEYPLPDRVASLRSRLYAALAPIANRWHEQLGLPRRFPEQLETWLEACHRAGQTRPTPLVLEYRAGDFNRLHQDVYGEYVFPLQTAILLSKPGTDFDGGEFVLTEQRARMQSRPMVVPLGQGDAVIFPVRLRPVASARGVSRVQTRHGVSEVRSGLRRTLGIILHDAS